MRQSKLSLVLIRVDIEDRPKLLLMRHRKWGDWSLVGGHVEPEEGNDWARAAARECNEELAPLQHGKDFVLLPVLAVPDWWGPVDSKSAGEPTMYTAQFFEMRFLRDAGACITELLRQHPEDLRLVDMTEFQLDPGATLDSSTHIVARALLRAGKSLMRQPAVCKTA